jgi:cytoskeleton protein RodZ
MLRRAREARGLTDQQAAEQLNLDPMVVVALESDDFAALGAPVFAKGHLRRYGAMLGLPEQELLAAYEGSKVQPDQPTLVPKSRLEMTPVRGRPKGPWVLGGALAFLLAAGLAAYVSEFGISLPAWSRGELEQQSGPSATNATLPPVATTPGAAPRPTAAPATSADGAAAPPAGIAPPGAAGETVVVPPGHVSISLAFAADSWAEIYDGSGKAVLYDLGQAGTQRTIAAAAPLSVTLGNAPTVRLQVNGRAVAVPTPPAGQTVARFTIGPDGSLR